MVYITPGALIAERMKNRGDKEINIGETVLIVYDTEIFNCLKKETNAEELKTWPYCERDARKIYKIQKNGFSLAMIKLEIGSPLLVFIIEILAALGAKKFLICTSSGSLTKSLGPGDIFFIKKAFSDNGITKSYFGDTEIFQAGVYTDILFQRIKSERNIRLVDSFSTDAIFRESFSKIEKYKKLGAEVVEMEAAAAFAVAEYRRVDAALLGFITDVLWDEKWHPLFDDDEVRTSKREVCKILLKLLISKPGGEI